MSFKSNVAAFWAWFAEHAAQIGADIEAQAHGDILKEFSTQLDRVFGKAHFLIGGRAGDFDLTISPEGNRSTLFLSRFWKEQAPEIPGWTFFHLKPPAGKAGGGFGLRFEVEQGNPSIDWSDVHVLPTPNAETKKLDIALYCEKLKDVDERTWFSYVFLLLDDCLGEAYTESAIGAIDRGQKKRWSMIPFGKLYDYVVRTFQKNGWQLFENPDEVASAYRMDPKTDIQGDRDDIAIGYTYHPGLINDYLGGTGEVIHAMRAVGAEYLFLVYNHAHVPLDQKVPYRAPIEDALDELLLSRNLGRLLGGATGSLNSYIDLLVFDMDEFDALVPEVLAQFDIAIRRVPFAEVLPCSTT